MSLYVVTQIKKQVDEAHQANLKQYSANRQKRQLKYYSLHLKQVVRIQRYFRSYLVKKTKLLEQQLQEMLQQRERMHEMQKRLDLQMSLAKQKRARLNNFSITKSVQTQKQNVEQNTRTVLKNVINCADNYAKNAALSKISMGQLASLNKQENELRAEIKQLQLQNQCYEQRVAGWNQKLKELRSKIMYQMSIKNQMELQLDCYQ